jgi:hypothetical protein
MGSLPVTTFTMREWDRSPSPVFEAARQATVHITTRGQTTYVMLPFEEYCRLTGSDPESLTSEICAAAASKRSKSRRTPR